MATIKCPNCGQTLNNNMDEKTIKCDACGTEFDNPDFNTSVEIKGRKFSKKEVEEKGVELKKKRFKILLGFGIFFIISGIGGMISISVTEYVEFLAIGVLFIIAAILYIKFKNAFPMGKKYLEKHTKAPWETIVSTVTVGNEYNLFEGGKLWICQNVIIYYEDGHSCTDVKKRLS